MWNGLWKLTAMVGVIGVGLFAVYQAQKGMNRTVAVAPGDNADGNERVEAGGDDANGLGSSADQSDSRLQAADDTEFRLEPRKNKSRKAQADPTEFKFDLGEPQAAAPEQKAKNKTSAQLASAKKTARKGIDFRDEADLFSDEFDASKDAPKKLPEDTATASKPAKKSNKQPIRQASATTEDVTASEEEDPFGELNNKKPERKDDPVTEEPASDPVKETSSSAQDSKEDFGAEDAFPDDVTPKTDAAPKSEAIAEESPQIESPKQDEPVSKPDEPAKDEADPFEKTDAAPGRAKITDFGSSSEPPRSNRAKRNAVKRGGSSTDADDNQDLFSDQPEPAKKPPAKKEKLVDDGNPVLGAPEPVDSLSTADPSNNRPIQPASGKKRPAELELPADDIVPSSRKAPPKSRTGSPNRLPADLDTDQLSEPPTRTRDPGRRPENERVTPVDMVGDGVIGDASQRGVQQPRLTIEKVAQQQAVLEQPFIYTIIVKNVGSVDAHNVVIEDRIPKGTELQGTHPQAELSGKRLIWNHLLLKPNEEKKISIKVVPKQEGPVGSVARVYFATEVAAEIVVAAPQLEFTVKAPREVRMGQSFDLVFNLKNVGKVDASNIVVRDFVPESLKHEAGTDIECPIGKLAPQEVREIVLPVTAIRTGSVMNQAVLTADSGVKKSLDSPIDVVGEVLVLTRTGQNRLYVEKPAVFTNNIRNDGNQRAEKVKVSEVVPAGMEFETASDGGRYDPNLRAVVWTLGPLSPGSDKSVTVKYVPRETGTLAGKITASGNGGSTAAVDSMVDVIGKPELQMETLSATGTVTVGDRITSKFQLNNTGTAAASNVQLRLRLPSELRLISVKGAKYRKDEDYIVFDAIDQLAPRSKAAYELVFEPIAEADAQIRMEVSAKHLNKPGTRIETIQIARDALK